MTSLRWHLDTDPIDQGATLTGKVFLDVTPYDFGAAQVELTLPGGSFEQVSLQPPSWLQSGSDHFESSLSEPGVFAIDVASVGAQAGELEVCGFSAVVTGPRGSALYLGAALLDAVDADALPLTAEPADAYVLANAGALGVYTTTLPDAEATVYYSTVLRAEGGRPPYTWSAVASDLPPQIALSPGGLIEGTPPSTAQNCSLTPQVRDDTGATVQQQLSLRILARSPAITTGPLPPASLGRRYSAGLAATGGQGPLTWSATGLPPGLALTGAHVSGTVAPEREAVRSYDVTFTVTDAALPPRSASVRRRLVVLPGRLLELPVNQPGAVLAAPNLLLTEYKIDIAAGAHTREDADTRAILNQAMEAIIGAIADLILGSGMGPDLPERPDRPRPGPGDPRPPRPDQPPGPDDGPPGPDDGPLPEHLDPAMHDALNELLQQYKDLVRMQSGAVVTSYSASVRVDGTEVCSVWRGLRTRGESGRIAVTHARARHRETKQSLAFREAVLKDRRRILDFTRRQIDAHFFGGAAAPNPVDWVYRAIDTALRRGRNLLRGVDLRLDPPADDSSGNCRAVLTPGPHRVETDWNIVAMFQEGSVLGAAEAASIQTTVSVSFRAVNPDGWPRLTGSAGKSYSGERHGHGDEVIVLPGDATDVLVQDTGTNQAVLLAATGSDDQPFAPRPFYVQPSAVVTSWVAGPADAIGRSSVFMLAPAHQRAAWNNGVHGYQQAIYTLSLQPVDAPRFMAPPDGGYSPVLVLQEGEIVEIRDFLDDNGFRAQPTSRQHSLQPDSFGDQASSFAGMPSIAPAERLVVTHRFGGSTQTYRLQNGELALTGHLNGLDTLSGVRFPLRTLRGHFVPGSEMFAQVHGQLGVLHVATLNATGTNVETVGQVAFPAPIADAAAGPGGDGVVVLTENGRNLWLIWWESLDEVPRLVPVWFGGGIGAIASSGSVGVFALPDAHAVGILVRE
jgi:hypothetical protein